MKNLNFKIVLLLVLGLSSCIKDDESTNLPMEEPHEIVFISSYGSDRAKFSDMIKLENHLYIADQKNGNKLVEKLDLSGNIVWEKQYGRGGLRSIGNNGNDVIFAGSTQDANSGDFLFYGSINQNDGSIQDSVTYEELVTGWEIIIAAHQENIFLLYAQNNGDVVLKSISLTGEEKWEKILNINNFRVEIIFTQDNNILVFDGGDLVDVASIETSETSEISLTKINPNNGDIIWQQVYLSSVLGNIFYDVIETPDQHIVLIGKGGEQINGDTLDYENDFVIFNDRGEIISKHNINKYPNRYAVLTPDGNIIIVAGKLISSFGPSSLSIGKFSPEGEKIWENTYFEWSPIAMDIDENENLYIWGCTNDGTEPVFQLIKTSKPQ